MDGSWKLAMHLAWERGLVYGSDYVFTYGPLSVLATRLADESLKAVFLLSDLIIYSIYSYILIRIWTRLKTCTGQLSLLVAILALNPPVGHHEESIALFLGAIFFVLEYSKGQKSLNLVVAGLLTIVNFFIKLNSGLLAAVYLILSLIVFYLFKRPIFRPTIIICVLSVICSHILPVQLESYLFYGLEIARGYSEAMALPLGVDSRMILGAACICLVFLAVFFIQSTRTMYFSERYLVLWLSIGVFFFFLFKQSFVRGGNHSLTFLHWITPFIGLILTYSPKNMALTPLFVFSLMFSFKLDRLTFEFYKTRFDRIGSSVLQFKRDATLPSPEDKLPESILKIVGDRTVDIMPYRIDLISKLNYLPRPIIQSYAAYTPILDRKNSENLRAEFVIFSLASIDGRYPWFDESRTKLSLYQFYELIHKEENWILLKRRQKPISCVEKPLSTLVARARKKISVPESNGLVYADIEINYTWLGELERLLFKPRVPQIDFYLSDGTGMSFAAIRPIISEHALVGSYLDSNYDAAKFFEGKFHELRKVDSIRFFLHDSPSFDKIVRYTFKEVRCVQ